MDEKVAPEGIRKLFVCLQGLMTIGLLAYGFGMVYSVPEPIPEAFALSICSAIATFGLIRRKRWTWIPAFILVLAIGFLATISIGISSVWMGGILVIPVGTIFVSWSNKTK